MKRVILFFILIVFVNCTSQKKLEETNVPFRIDTASHTGWIGGTEQSGSGGILKIKVTPSSTSKNIIYEKVYFRERVIPVKLLNKGEGVYELVCEYTRDDVDDSNTNTTRRKNTNDFDLAPSEAVIYYKEGNDIRKYFKIKSIKEKQPLIYPSKSKKQ